MEEASDLIINITNTVLFLMIGVQNFKKSFVDLRLRMETIFDFLDIIASMRKFRLLF